MLVTNLDTAAKDSSSTLLTHSSRTCHSLYLIQSALDIVITKRRVSCRTRKGETRLLTLFKLSWLLLKIVIEQERLESDQKRTWLQLKKYLLTYPRCFLKHPILMGKESTALLDYQKADRKLKSSLSA